MTDPRIPQLEREVAALGEDLQGLARELPLVREAFAASEYVRLKLLEGIRAMVAHELAAAGRDGLAPCREAENLIELLEEWDPIFVDPRKAHV